MKSICVYCGSSAGANPIYMEASKQLGTALASAGLDVVYGGADVGLMNQVADAALSHGGRVIGVIPKAFAYKIKHVGLSELHVVESMHQRKALMADLSDGFIALPGGFGTLDELFEMLTWAQLGFHSKPCGLLNVGGYYDQLLGFLDHVADQGFMRSQHRNMLQVATTPTSLLSLFQAYVPPVAGKWVNGANEGSL